MSDTRTIEAGESLLQLAYEAGFDSWKRVWNHEPNRELRERRKDPQVLLPGDEITVPPRDTTPTDSCPVNKIHRFRLERPRAWINLRLLDDEGEPLAGLKYRLTAGSVVHEGTTSAEGELSVEIEPNAQDGHLVLWNDASTPCFEAPVKIGYLDPTSSPSGLLARLVNLGVERLLSPHVGGRAPVSAQDLLFFTPEFQNAWDEDPAERITALHDKRTQP